jgi:hypothetical protein
MIYLEMQLYLVVFCGAVLLWFRVGAIAFRLPGFQLADPAGAGGAAVRSPCAADRFTKAHWLGGYDSRPKPVQPRASFRERMARRRARR